jgi:hypothetical protein
MDEVGGRLPVPPVDAYFGVPLVKLAKPVDSSGKARQREANTTMKESPRDFQWRTSAFGGRFL